MSPAMSHKGLSKVPFVLYLEQRCTLSPIFRKETCFEVRGPFGIPFDLSEKISIFESVCSNRDIAEIYSLEQRSPFIQSPNCESHAPTVAQMQFIRQCTTSTR